MTSSEPLTAVLDMLAACREQLTRLDDREAGHHSATSGQLTEIGSHLTALTQTLQQHATALDELTTARSGDAAGYCPVLPPAWWNLPPGARREPGYPAAFMGGAGVPARLRPPGRRPRAMLGLT
jgi:hypothetical protein